MVVELVAGTNFSGGEIPGSATGGAMLRWQINGAATCIEIYVLVTFQP